MSSVASVSVPKSVLDDLKCDRCSRYLSVPPIMQDRQNKLTCGRCRNSVDSTLLFRSIAFETVAKLLLFPCSYEGCDKQELSWGSVVLHELSCEHQFHACPVMLLSICRWKGNWMTLLEHFKKDHKHLVNVNSFTINLKERIRKISLMSLRNQVFFVHIYINSKLNKLSVDVQHLGKPETAKKLSYTLKFRHIDNNGDKKKIMFEDGIISNYDWTLQNFSKTHINISSIKDVLNESEVICEIEILIEASPSGTTGKRSAESHQQASHSKALSKNQENNSKGSSSDLNMLTDLECPICMEFMIPPIFVCQNGHSVCGECKKKLQNCSSYRAPLGNTRNFLLEKLTTHIRYPCKNSSLGCPFVGNSSDLTDHHKGCSPAISECPLKGLECCVWKGSSTNCFKHLLQKHKGKIWKTFGNSILRDLSSPTVTDVNILNRGDHIFKISCKHSLKAAGSISWTFQQIGLRPNEVSPYKFRIKFLAPPNSTMEFQIDSLCLAETSYKDVFKNSLTIPYSLLVPFIASSKHLHFT